MFLCIIVYYTIILLTFNTAFWAHCAEAERVWWEREEEREKQKKSFFFSDLEEWEEANGTRETDEHRTVYE